MRIRRESLLPWTLWILAALLGCATLALTVANRDAETRNLIGSWQVQALLVIVIMSVPTVGAIVASLRPRNSVGWLLMTAGLLYVFELFAGGYATYTIITNPGVFPGGAFMVWANSTWGWTPIYGLLAALFLVFPSGRVRDRPWRFVLWGIVIASLTITVGYAFRPGPYDDQWDFLANPYAPSGAAAELMVVLASTGSALSYLGIVVGAVGLLARFWRARGPERQQLKWLAYSAGVTAGVFPLGIAIAALAPSDQLMGPLTVVLLLLPTTIPIAAGLAVLRYRLYDVDLFINRTLVYGATTAAIAATFWVGILALQRLLSPVTSGSEPAIAASTLVSLALFQPVRRRMQGAVDKRFDRSRYDAARTVDGFAERLRDEVDLDEVRADLIGSVQQTVAPAHTSLWLREPAR